MIYRGAPNKEPNYRQLVMGEFKPLTSGQTLSRMKIVAGPDKADNGAAGITLTNSIKDYLGQVYLSGVTLEDH